MNLLETTLLYMVLSIMFTYLTDHFLYKYDIRDYKVFSEKQRLVFMMTIISMLYLIYTIAFNNSSLPLIILSICISIIWIWFFIMDIDLKFYRLYEKIILLSITLIVFISLFFSIEYILLLGLTKSLKIDLWDKSENRTFVMIKMISYKDLELNDNEYFLIYTPTIEKRDKLFHTLETMRRLEVNCLYQQQYLNNIHKYIDGCVKVPLNFGDVKEITTFT